MNELYFELLEDEESRPRLYYIKNMKNGMESEPFFMGEIQEKVGLLQSLGFVVITPADEEEEED